MEMTKNAVLQLLEEQHIPCLVEEHEAVCTMEEIDALGLPNGDRIAKNIFLHDRRSGRFFLLSLRKDKRMDWKRIRSRPDSRRADFAAEEELHTVLGLSRGQVTPLAVLGGQERRVTVLLDSAFQGGLIGVHPNTNTAMVWLQAGDLFQLLQRNGHPVEWIEI